MISNLDFVVLVGIAVVLALRVGSRHLVRELALVEPPNDSTAHAILLDRPAGGETLLWSPLTPAANAQVDEAFQRLESVQYLEQEETESE